MTAMLEPISFKTKQGQQNDLSFRQAFQNFVFRLRMGTSITQVHFIKPALDCKQALPGQSRWCAHSAARLEREEINEKKLFLSPFPAPPQAPLRSFAPVFSRSAISRDLSTIQKGTACSLNRLRFGLPSYMERMVFITNTIHTFVLTHRQCAVKITRPCYDVRTLI